MQLAVLIAILLSFSGIQADSVASIGPPSWPILAACLLAAPVTAFAVSAWLVRGIARDFPSHSQWIDRYEWLQKLAMGIWLGAIAIAFCGYHWPMVVRASGGWTAWPMAADLAAVAPVLGTLFLIWTAFWFVERSLCPSRLSLTTYLLSQTRHFLLLPLLPVLAVLAGRELLEWWSPNVSSSGIGQLLQGGGVLALLVLAPLVVRRIWSTAPLQTGELRDRLLAACAANGCRLNDILLWDTSGRMANAAILGFMPGMRYLLVTDVLLDTLSPKELELVLCHEATHVGRRHLLLRIGVLVLPLWLWFWSERLAPGMEANVTALLASVSLGGYANLMLLAVAAGYAILAIGWVSHRVEFEADLGVLPGKGLSEERESNAASFSEVLCRITGDVHHSSWMHPSVHNRIAFLEACARDPRQATAYARRMDWLWYSVVALYVGLPLLGMAVLFISNQ
jgi:Zn-dependent protease with chaperone function